MIDAAELTDEDLPKKHGGLLVISQSGETKDVFSALALAQQRDLPCFSIVNAVCWLSLPCSCDYKAYNTNLFPKVGSQIARHSTCGVYLNAGREHAVASTKAFTCQATVLALVAIWFSQVNSPTDQQKRKGSGSSSLDSKFECNVVFCMLIWPSLQ